MIHRILTCSRTPPCLQLLIDLSHLAPSWDKGGDRVYRLKEAIHGQGGVVSLLRKRPPRTGDQVWRGTVVQVHRLYRFYHLLHHPLLRSHSSRIIMAPLHHLANMVMAMVNLIRVLVHGSHHRHCQAMIQGPCTPRLPSSYRPPCHFIMNKSHLCPLRFSTRQKTRRHGIKPLSMSILIRHLKRILVIHRLHHTRKINTMSTQPHNTQLMKDTRI